MQARVVKTHDVRRDEILGCAEKLFATAGYERTTVNAIIDQAGIAKGTFYHYFVSKEELLNGLVERLSARILAAVAPILDDDSSAVDKLRRIHETAGAIKGTHSALLLQHLRVFYRPENLLARHKMTEKALEATIPVYAQVIRQGVAEGLFDAQHPDADAEILLRAWMGLGDAIAQLLLEGECGPEGLMEARHRLAAYDEVAERALGAAPCSLGLADAARRALESLERSLALAGGGNGGAS